MIFLGGKIKKNWGKKKNKGPIKIIAEKIYKSWRG